MARLWTGFERFEGFEGFERFEGFEVVEVVVGFERGAICTSIIRVLRFTSAVTW